tara:strand:+ start:54 stop:440 length:387 start_codon:yes stop_codon:yes gene_type:complete
MATVADSICIKSLSTMREAVASTLLDHPELKDELMADPAKFLAKVLPGASAEALSKLTIKVVDEPMDTLVLPIPCVPEDLSPEQLESVAGGAFFFATPAAVAVTAAVAGGLASGAAGAGVAHGLNQIP